MKSVIISVFVSLLYTRLAAGMAIQSPPAIQLVSPNSTTLADDKDLTHCSTDYASYGQMHPGTVACVLASYDLFQDPKISTLQSNYPMDFVSSTAPMPAEGNGFRTPWRSTYGECTVAIAMLSEVPRRFTPEAPAGSSGQSAIVFKIGLERANNNLMKCFTPGEGTNIGWAEAETFVIGGDGRVGIFAFKNGSPLDRALPDGPRVPKALFSNADLTTA